MLTVFSPELHETVRISGTRVHHDAKRRTLRAVQKSMFFITSRRDLETYSHMYLIDCAVSSKFWGCLAVEAVIKLRFSP